VTEAEWDQRYAGTELVWTARPNVFVVEEAADLPAGTAVDMACGEGRNAVWLARQGWTVTGVDFSGVGLDKAKQLADSAGVEVRWEQADVLAWQPPSVFDLVLLAYLQVPPAQRRAALAVAASATAPGGSLLVVAHDLRNLQDGVGGPSDPSRLWTPEEVDVPGFVPARRGTAVRHTDAGDALDTVVRLVRSASATS
jgi:SAM-dependent methyltransferase